MLMIVVDGYRQVWVMSVEFFNQRQRLIDIVTTYLGHAEMMCTGKSVYCTSSWVGAWIH